MIFYPFCISLYITPFLLLYYHHILLFCYVLQAEEQMQALISEHEGLQTTLAEVNRQVSGWTYTLDHDHHTQEELRNTAQEIQATKAKLGKCMSQ